MEGMKTLDIRSYRETIKAAVARERQADPNWSWGIRSITKGVARIGWGYLDYIGEKEAFTVEVLQDEENGKVAVLGVADGDIEYGDLSVGPDDADELGYYMEDGPFADLMDTFLRCMAHARRDGGLYCDGVVSKEA